jgi:hypothetical protein
MPIGTKKRNIIIPDQVQMGTEQNNNNCYESEKRLINGHEFELRFVTCKKNKANREARKHIKHGFHPRVLESPPGRFLVYRRHKTTDKAKPADEL